MLAHRYGRHQVPHLRGFRAGRSRGQGQDGPRGEGIPRAVGSTGPSTRTPVTRTGFGPPTHTPFSPTVA
jgi:hypothetical protein